MFKTFKDELKKILTSRLFVLSIVLIGLFVILFHRIFTLQIVNGQGYSDKYTLTIEKERITNGTRGNIYDRNGKLLAYNELSYSVVIEDSGRYDSEAQKNARLNTELAQLISIIDGNGDMLSNDFPIVLNEWGNYEFTVSGTSLQRFRADVYGYKTIDELKKNRNKLGYEESDATAGQIVEFLRSDKMFGIRLEGMDTPSKDDERHGQIFLSKDDAYKVLVIRYAMNQNNFRRYIQTTVATGVSDKTVATVKENAEELTGVDIIEDTIRRYVNSKYFSHIIGYTGKISQEEYDELVLEDESYTLTDVVGKSGIEQAMESVLHGTKGHEYLYVDHLGRVVEIKDVEESSSGNDVYISLDTDLTVAIYELIEQELAGILYTKIENVKEYTAAAGSDEADIIIPIYDVYYTLINNNILDFKAFGDAGASSVEQSIHQSFLSRQSQALAQVDAQLRASNPTIHGQLSEEMQTYLNYVHSMLVENGIYDTDVIDTEDETYLKWRRDQISMAEYLRYAISKEWVNITDFETDSKYSDSSEIYDALLGYIQEQLLMDKTFSKRVYKYMIKDDQVSGSQLCLALYEQGVLEPDNEKYEALKNGSLDAYSFLREKIQKLEITPAQLALDPCTGSCVVINPQNGELLACVSYPGYDTNRLANQMDSAYYNSLQDDLSLPLYSNATQQRTAPGSTFKPVTAVASLTERIVASDTVIDTKGKFDLVQDGPTCWIYPQNHGSITISEAIRDSCNYFFYMMGYDMSLNGETYSESKGINTLTRYAEMFGLGEKTGIEVPESEPKISDEYPIVSAIGQGRHSFTTTELARYAAAIASSGKVYKLTLLDKVTDSEGNLIKDYGPEVISTMSEVSTGTWNAVHTGMRMVVENSKVFRDFPATVPVAGKTGTAQEIATRPNHAVFIGYAPYNRPEVAVATRIAYGYASTNAEEVSRYVLEYYFNLTDRDALLDGEANEVSESANTFTD